MTMTTPKSEKKNKIKNETRSKSASPSKAVTGSGGIKLAKTQVCRRGVTRGPPITVPYPQSVNTQTTSQGQPDDPNDPGFAEKYVPSPLLITPMETPEIAQLHQAYNGMGKAMQAFLNESATILRKVYDAKKEKDRVDELEAEIVDLKAKITSLERLRAKEKGTFKKDILTMVAGLIDSEY